MRSMKRGDATLNVYGHALLNNGIEYYFVDNKHYSNIRKAFAHNLTETVIQINVIDIQKHMLMYSYGNMLFEIMPANGWVWADNISD